MQRIDRLEMNKWLRRILKTTGGIAVGAVVLLGGATLLLNTESVQKKIQEKAVELLSQKLETEVEIDSISISALTQEISLYGIEIEDREEREMLKVGKISVNLELIRLLQHKIVIEKAEIAHAKALLLKPSKEEPANYQFVIDAFKKPKDQKSPEKQAKKSKMDLDISALALKNGIVPPTVHLDSPDPECDLDYTPNKARQFQADIAISNTFGFGGQNATVALRAIKK